MWVFSKNRGKTPQNGWFIYNGNPGFKMGWFGGKTHHVRKHPYNDWNVNDSKCTYYTTDIVSFWPPDPTITHATQEILDWEGYASSMGMRVPLLGVPGRSWTSEDWNNYVFFFFFEITRCCKGRNTTANISISKCDLGIKSMFFCFKIWILVENSSSTPTWHDWGSRVGFWVQKTDVTYWPFAQTQKPPVTWGIPGVENRKFTPWMKVCVCVWVCVFNVFLKFHRFTWHVLDYETHQQYPNELQRSNHSSCLAGVHPQKQHQGDPVGFRIFRANTTFCWRLFGQTIWVWYYP